MHPSGRSRPSSLWQDYDDQRLGAAQTREGGIILRRSSALRLLDDTLEYRLRRRALICGAI
ncbi:MAG: hypothetical protein V1929_03950 [bacterium]